MKSVQEMTFDECFDYVTEHHDGIPNWENVHKRVIQTWCQFHELRAASKAWKVGFEAGVASTKKESEDECE